MLKIGITLFLKKNFHSIVSIQGNPYIVSIQGKSDVSPPLYRGYNEIGAVGKNRAFLKYLKSRLKTASYKKTVTVTSVAILSADVIRYDRLFSITIIAFGVFMFLKNIVLSQK